MRLEVLCRWKSFWDPGFIWKVFFVDMSVCIHKHCSSPSSTPLSSPFSHSFLSPLLLSSLLAITTPSPPLLSLPFLSPTPLHGQNYGQPLNRVLGGNYEYRVFLRCRHAAKLRFIKLRSDVLVKLQLLDNKRGEGN